MDRSSRPEFVGPGWLLPPQGFSYRSKAPVGLVDRTNDADEWTRFLALVEQLKRAAFDQAFSLLELVSRTGAADIRILGLRVLGHAAPNGSRERLAEFFRHDERETRVAAYEAALFSCDLAMIDPLLDARERSAGQEKLQIMSVISHLLETEPDTLYDDLDELTADEYRRIAFIGRQKLEADHGRGIAIFEARPLELDYILQRIEALCDELDAVEFSGAISTYVDFFEAMTGYSSRHVFDESVTVNCHRAIEMVATFQQSGTLEQYQPGQRYFFGHRVPS